MNKLKIDFDKLSYDLSESIKSRHPDWHIFRVATEIGIDKKTLGVILDKAYLKKGANMHVNVYVNICSWLGCSLYKYLIYAD